uniref:DUF4371 domain-containing protein n=1 Tax=Latimeria chalumnae TaxID=7897 RepID=H3AN93_LATCH
FSVVIDETRDVSEHEQLVFAVRWVGSNYEVAEEFVGLYGCTKMDAIFLLNIIKDVLLQMGLDLKNICGQTYDSASVLQGKAFGEATLLKKENPKALSIHCLNHSLNLVLQEAAKSCLMVRSALEAVHKVHNIIHASAKKLAIFIEGGQTEAVKKAPGLISLMEKFDTFLGLKVCFSVFSACEEVARVLQSKTVTAETALICAVTLRERLNSLRSDTCFAEL